jgi:hypothetical protein
MAYASPTDQSDEGNDYVSDHLLHVGWNPDLDIPTGLIRVPSARLASSVALITTLDSTSTVADLPSLVPHLRNAGLDFAHIDHDVLVDIPTLAQLLHDEHHEWFTGFDELYICSSPPEHGKPDHVRITSDKPLTIEPHGLGSWMKQSTCFLALGDGDGLNFATVDIALAELLRPAMSNET